MQPKPDPKGTGQSPSVTYRRGRPRQMFVREDSSYQPTKAELEEDMRIPDATPEELAQALFGRHPKRSS